MTARVQLIAASILAYARQSPKSARSSAADVLAATIRDKFNIQFTDTEFHEAADLLHALGCINLYRLAGVQDYIEVLNNLWSAFGPRRDTQSSGKLGEVFVGWFSDYRSNRRKFSYLASYCDLGQEWLNGALSILRTESSSDNDSLLKNSSDDYGLPLPDDAEELLQQVASASDRLVSFSDNSKTIDDAIEKTETANEAIRASNLIDIEIKERVLTDVNTGLAVLKSGGRVAVATIRFLILDRLVEAYKSAIEDSLKTIIQAAIIAVSLALVGLI